MRQAITCGPAEFGFFTSRPPGDFLPPVILRQKRAEHVPGLPAELVGYSRLTVQTVAGPFMCILLSHVPDLPESTASRIPLLIQMRYPGAVVSRELEDRDGYSRVVSDSGAMVVAAATAEAKRAGSWDESKVFRIVVNDRSMDVKLNWNGGAIEAEVQDAAG